MKLLKIVLKIFLVIITLPILYLLIAMALGAIEQNTEDQEALAEKHVYISTNGVHLDFIIPIEFIDPKLLEGLQNIKYAEYISFGWGDKNFYLNTPKWADLTFTNACTALIWNSESLVHVTSWKKEATHWVKIRVSDKQFHELNAYIHNSFGLNDAGNKVILPEAGYGTSDEFYEAVGSYTCFNTCNSWVNRGLYESNMKCCLWTPFDKAVLDLYPARSSLSEFTVGRIEEVHPNGNREGWGCPAVSNDQMKILDEYLRKSTTPVLLWVFR